MTVHFFCGYPPGPGLAIRVICADEPYVCKDFAETNNILKIITDFSASVKKVTGGFFLEYSNKQDYRFQFYSTQWELNLWTEVKYYIVIGTQ